MISEDRIKKDFLEIHTKMNGRTTPLRWCVKKGQTVSFAILPELECWKCEEFILNSGICDPL